MSISKYRKFIFSLGQQLSTENLSSLKYLLRDLLTTNQTEGINSPTDLFVLLEQRNDLGSDNCHLLKDLLRQIKRQDLVRKVEDFERRQLLAGHNRTENDEVVPLQRNGSVRAVNTEDMHYCVPDGKQAHATVCETNNANGSSGRQVMLRDVSADIIEKLGFLLNPTCVKNWIYLAGKLDYTYAQVSNYKLCPMQSTQILLYDWATREDATVLKLYRVLMDIGREDAARVLELVLASTTSCSTPV